MHPSQNYSCNGSHTKSLSHKPRQPKLTVEQLVKAVPKIGSITQRQLASRVHCSTAYTSKVVDEAISQGLIECYPVMGVEKHFRRTGADA